MAASSRGTAARRAPFVGRQKELDALTDALASAVAGEGGVVLICGEAGIGKTRLARELERLAKQQGTLCLCGNCYEDEGASAYRPWAEIAAAYLERAGAGAAREHMGEGAVDLAEVIPAVRFAMPDLPMPSRADSPASTAEERAQIRHRLADSMKRFLGHASADAALVLVFDGLQHCDRASLWMLELVARDAAARRTLIVATCTEREARSTSLEETLGELDKLPWSRRVHVGALGRDDVDSLVTQALGSAAEPALIEEIWRKTEGVPLFVTEALKCLAGRAREETGGVWENEVAGIVRAAVSRRLNKMREERRELLAAAAGLSRELTPRELSAVVARDVHLVEKALDDSVAGRANKEVADALCTSYHTVVDHLKSIYRKTGVHRRAALATYAARHGMTRPEA